jgi:hypothetical protein
MTKKQKQTAVAILSGYMLSWRKAHAAGDRDAEAEYMDRVKRYENSITRVFELLWECGIIEDYTRGVLQAAQEIFNLAFELSKAEFDKAAA